MAEQISALRGVLGSNRGHPATWVAALFLSAAIAGCSSPPATPSVSVVDETSVFYEQYKAAIAAEASEEQVAVLKTASETETLEFDTVNELVEQSLACIEDAGIGVVRKAPEELGPDYLIPSYAIAATASGMSEAQADALSNECITKHSYFAELARQLSPHAVDARDDRLREQLPAIIECLNSNGVAATADETPDEIRAKVLDLLMKTHESGADVMCYDDFSIW